jgi:predicted nuclease with TOPRIM domain
MAKQSAPLIEVHCPCCEARLQVDSATGAVITHKEKPKPAPVEDLKAAVARLKKEESERDEKFRKQVERERQNQEILNKRFDELLKQAKADPEKGPPKRPFDF